MMEGLCFISSKYRVTKGFKFHARPQTGAYSCFPMGAAHFNYILKLNTTKFIQIKIFFFLTTSEMAQNGHFSKWKTVVNQPFFIRFEQTLLP